MQEKVPTSMHSGRLNTHEIDLDRQADRLPSHRGPRHKPDQSLLASKSGTLFKTLKQVFLLPTLKVPDSVCKDRIALNAPFSVFSK